MATAVYNNGKMSILRVLKVKKFYFAVTFSLHVKI